MAIKRGVDAKEETTVSPLPPSGACDLVVVWEGGSVDVSLPLQGSLVIGRSASADIVAPHGSASRQHARIHLGSSTEIEDLASANGTRIDGVALEPGRRYPVPLGAVVSFGEVRAILHRRASGGATESEAGSSSAHVQHVLDRVAGSDISIILIGETGAGKEVVAGRIHRQSPRSDKPFVALNCAALAENLLESELFGHERGAFTGAVTSKAGLLESAGGGTVLLDEIGEMPLSTQAKLLRVIETREALRLGALRPVKIDVRFIAATHRDLDLLVVMGRFREDLLYRLNGITVALPPLRDRVDEMPALVTALLHDACARAKKPVLSVADHTMTLLCAYRWPGNVRELKNVIERAVLLCAGSRIEPWDIVFGKAGATYVSASVAPPSMESLSLPGASAAAPATDEDRERERIVLALSQCAGNQTAAAAQLGMTRRMLTYRIEKLGLPRPRPRS